MKFGRFLLWFLRPLFFLLFPYKVKGLNNIPENNEGRLILCSNHISIIDPVFLLMAFKSRPIFYMAKAELFSNKLAVWLFQKQFGAFPVRRGQGDTGSLDTAEKIVCEGKLMGIFPEGTRSKDGKLGRAKSGAALIASRTGASVLPVAIKAKNQKVRLFHKTHILIGRPVPPDQLHTQDSEKPDLRYASRMIMEQIAKMMEEDA
ncbi:MAG: lysophospholipid acyltransferase family protein [Oscillospiraceae bacterium]|nr:lysophospholipid acyltransferase family protein [Oscillospiraceae bacterium]